MVVLPPGTLLQLMYLRERLQNTKPGRFVEIGPGSGEVSQLLLDLGWTGQAYDLEAVTVERLQMRFVTEIRQGRYAVSTGDYLSQPLPPDSVDMVISCMVMEHLMDDSEIAFMRKSTETLKSGGLMVGLVPGSPAHWGIEDDVAGHCRRYTRDKIEGLMANTGWTVVHLAGLTFPLSNFLLPVSNFLVSLKETRKLSLSAIERTKSSGRRDVRFKTHFPSFFGMLLNRHVLWPLHVLQKMFRGSDHALVIYFESRPIPRSDSI
jgi:SAM-dependent methyltransferase